MVVVFIPLTVFIGYLLYVRYVPVRGVQCIRKDQLSAQPVLVDLRDYSDSAKEVVVGAVALPIAYIKRHHKGLPKEGVAVIASDEVERNIGIRLLRRHGHVVTGYAIIDNPCKCKKYLTEFAS